MKEADRVRLSGAEQRGLARDWGGRLQPPAGQSTQLPASPLRRGRWTLLAAVICGALVGVAQKPSMPHPSPVPAPEWNIELSSRGNQPVHALVLGREAGLHLVQLPAADAPKEERRRIAARLARGNVYLVSVGGTGLQVGTKGPPGSGVVAMSAQARFVKLFQRPDATGISTGWW